jgi:hypothetical protein
MLSIKKAGCRLVVVDILYEVTAGVVVSTLAAYARDRGSIPGYAVTQAIRMRL